MPAPSSPIKVALAALAALIAYQMPPILLTPYLPETSYTYREDEALDRPGFRSQSGSAIGDPPLQYREKLQWSLLLLLTVPEPCTDTQH